MSYCSSCVPRDTLFFFNDTATPEIYTLSLHDALPISMFAWLPFVAADLGCLFGPAVALWLQRRGVALIDARRDRKSTRLNSSHSQISYAVFCLKKKTKKQRNLSFRLHSNNPTRQGS